MRDSERWFSVAYGLWLFGIFAYFIPAATWNPVSRFDLTRAIVEQRTLSIDAFVDNTGDRALSRGHWYTEKAPISSLLAVPAYAMVHVNQKLRHERPEYSVFATTHVPAQRVTVNGAFQRGLYVCSLSTSGLGTAVLGVLLFRVLRRRFSTAAALVGSAGTVLGTPLLPYATSFYGHGPAAAFLVGAFAALFPERDQPSPSATRWAGAFLALAAGCEYLAAIPAAILFLAWLFTLQRRDLPRRLIDLSAGALVPVVVIGGYHTLCFGAPWRTGYAFVVRPEFARGHASGLMGIHPPTLSGLHGLLFGTNRGLFYLAPFAVIAVAFGLLDAARSRDAGVRAAQLAFFALLSVNAGYYMWWGGAAAGPRHLVPSLGFLAFGLAAAWQSRARRLTAALLGVSIVNLVVLTAVGLEAPDHGNLLTEYAYRRFLRGDIAALSGASNMGIRAGLPRAGSLGPVLVWLLLGGRFLVRRMESWVDVAVEPSPPD